MQNSACMLHQRQCRDARELRTISSVLSYLEAEQG